MKIGKWIAQGSAASLIVGATLGVFLLGQGITYEVPMGSFSAQLVMAENGRPLPNVAVYLEPVESLGWEELELMPPEDRPQSYVRTTDASGRVNFSHVRAGFYQTRTSAKAHSLNQTIAIEEGRAEEQVFELQPNPPFLDAYLGQHVFLPGAKASVDVHGFIDTDQIEFLIYRIDPDKLFAAQSLYSGLSSISPSSWRARKAPSTMGREVQRFVRTATDRDAEGVFRQPFALPDLPKGLYWVEVQAKGLEAGTWISVSQIALVTKTAPSQLSIFVTDLATGKPISGALIEAGKNGKPLSLGTTSSEGLLSSNSGDSRNDRLVRASFDGSDAFIDIYSYGGSDEQYRLFLQTDRPIYRPGDRIQFRGTLRALEGVSYAAPPSGRVLVRILDPERVPIQSEEIALNTFGSFGGEFSVNGEAPPGQYLVEVNYGEFEDVFPVTIAAYRKPEYSITVTPSKPSFVRGERVRFVVKAEYYFGAPVVGAKVVANVSRSPQWGFVSAEDEEDYLEYEEMYGGEGYYGGEWVGEYVATTNERGEALIDFDSRFDDAWVDDTDSKFTAYVGVTDGDKYFDGEGAVVVSRGEFGLDVTSDRWVADVGKPIEFEVRAFAHKTYEPLAGRRVRLTAAYSNYTRTGEVFEEIDSNVVTTGENGSARASFQARRGGYIRVRAATLDSKNNEILASTYVYAYDGAGDWIDRRATGVRLTLDKKQYSVGERAVAVIQTDQPGGFAWVTVEADRVYSSRVVELRSGVTRVEIPVTKECLPNAFVSVSYVKNRKFMESSRRLGVDLGVNRLQVEIEADKSTYRPGDRATYEVSTRDESGRPVSAEVAFGVVDEAIYALASDRTNVVGTFYPKRYNSVSTDYSFADLYLDGGDKAPSDIQIRSKFEDTAFWAPSVVTDSSGRAQISFILPDNLTTWRATATAITASTQVGSSTFKVRASKPLMLRILTREYYVQRDTQRLLAMVTNDSAADASVQVELEAAGATIRGEKRRVVHVKAGATVSLEWSAEFPDAGTATFLAKAWTGSESDGMQKSVPIRVYGRAVVQWKSGLMEGTSSEVFSVRPGADPSAGALEIELSPTVGSAVVQSLDELIGFPYGCVEQTMSRFLPTVVVADTLKKLSLPPIRRQAEIPSMVAEGYSRLRKMRIYNAAWGWWEYGDPDEFMTALVLEGLDLAKKAGYPSENIDPGPAVKWLSEKASLPWSSGPDSAFVQYDRKKRSYTAYVLALYGQKERAQSVLFALGLEQLTPLELANVSLAYHALGSEFTSKRDAALGKMLAAAQRGENLVSWEEEYWGFETTARCLLALATIRPTDPEIPKVVHYLMIQRRGSTWASTRDTAYIVVALCQYLRGTGGVDLQGALTVSINGKEVRVLDLAASSPADPNLRIRVPLKDLIQGDNRIEFKKETPGAGFFSAKLTQYVGGDTLPPSTTDPGLKISRRFAKLEVARMEDGTLRLVPSKAEVTSVKRGDLIRCLIDVTSDTARQFVMVEAPIPSNFRIMEREEIGIYEEWYYPWSKHVVFDDKIVFFLKYMGDRKRSFEFTLRAENPGKASALPAVLFNMYEPNVRSSTSATTLEVRPE